MARKPKPRYEVGQEVWVRAKITRIAPHSRLPQVTDVTVQMSNGNRETLWIDADDESTIRPIEHA